MSDAPLRINTEDWVRNGRFNATLHLQRQVAETILYAISTSEHLKHDFFLKGGSLMGLAYNSPRQTNDIDLTSTWIPSQKRIAELERVLLSGMRTAAASLGYDQLIFKVHSIKPEVMPLVDDKRTWPTLAFRIGYAKRGGNQEQRLANGKANNAIKIDITFSEPIGSLQILEMTDGKRILAYDLVWLVAEKYRAILQQPIRNRARRQDVYDINLLLLGQPKLADSKDELLATFLSSCEFRNILPTRFSLDDERIKKMSAADWNSLEKEIDPLPDFNECYERVAGFYRSLPWIAASPN
jgi:Nucleotidyl transferase AbiEii toxin, Type IV TA system